MTADPLDQVLTLVAEGRLTPEEAAPILAALDEMTGGPPGPGFAPGPGPGFAFGAGFAAGFGAPAPGGGSGTGAGAGTPGSGAGSLRIEVREAGRQVVNVRLPIAVGRLALDRVPGLSGDQVDRVREALGTGMRGPVLEVDDGDNQVRIVLE